MRRAVLWAAAAVPILLGIVVGLIVRAYWFLWSAFIEGYMIGRGQ